MDDDILTHMFKKMFNDQSFRPRKVKTSLFTVAANYFQGWWGGGVGLKTRYVPGDEQLPKK
jgi:hypothetical protein